MNGGHQRRELTSSSREDNIVPTSTCAVDLFTARLEIDALLTILISDKRYQADEKLISLRSLASGYHFFKYKTKTRRGKIWQRF